MNDMKILEKLEQIIKEAFSPSKEVEQACIELAEARMEAKKTAEQAEIKKLQTMQRIERIDKNINFIANHIKKQYHYE